MNATYNVDSKLSLNGYFHFASEKNDDLNLHDWERTALTPGATALFIPAPQLALSGGFSFSKVESNAKTCIPVMDG